MMNALLDHICYWIDGTCVVVDCFNTKNTKKMNILEIKPISM